MAEPESVVVGHGVAVDILRVLAGFQGMLRAGEVPSASLIGSSLRELGVDRTVEDAPEVLASVIERLVDALRESGV